MNPFLFAVLVSFAVNALFFAYAAARKTDVVTDLSYSLSFALVSAALVVAYYAAGIVALLPAVLTIAWAARLGSYLFSRIRRIKVDHRFDRMRDKPAEFAKFWILQAVAVPVILSPVVAAASSAARGRAFGFWEAAGTALWLAGFAVEWLADAQKSSYRRTPGATFIRTGLWSWSRHPNYFGESLLWWGLFVLAVPALSGWAWLSALGPAFITFLLLFVSGVPLLEKSADAKYGTDPDYAAYKARTSLFVPLPPARAAAPASPGGSPR